MTAGEVRRSQAILVAGHAIRLAVAVAITAVVGRASTPDAFGFFTFVGSLFVVAHLLLDLGTTGLAVREIARSPERERPLLEGLVGWRRLAGVGLALGALLLAWAEDDPERRVALLGVALALPLLAPGALEPVFIVRQTQGPPAVARLGGQGLALGGAFVLRAASLAGAAFAWVHVVRELLSVLLLRGFAVRSLGYRPRAGIRGRRLRPFVAMAAVQGLATLLHIGTLQADVFLVRALRGEAELGAYGAAFRPVQPFLFLPALVLAPLLPVLARDALRDRGAFRRGVRRAGARLTLVGVLGMGVGIAAAPLALRLLYGGSYLEGELAAIGALRWTLVAMAAAFASASVGTALLADGRERALVRVRAIGLVVKIAGSLVLLPTFGFVAAAWTTAATEVAVGLGLLAAYRSGGPGRSTGTR